MNFLITLSFLACLLFSANTFTLEEAKKNPLVAYVLTDALGNVISDSGVRLGPLDFKFETIMSLKKYGIPQNLIEKFQPYIGKFGQAAIVMLKTTPLVITKSEFQVIEDKIVAFWKPKLAEIPDFVKKDPSAMRLAMLAKTKQWPELLDAIALARQQINKVPPM